MPCSRSPGGSAWSWGCLVLGGCLVPGVLLQGGAWSQGVAWSGGVPAPRGACSGGSAPVETPRKQTATVADGAHPTGMHSCLKLCMYLANIKPKISHICGLSIFEDTISRAS